MTLTTEYVRDISDQSLGSSSKLYKVIYRRGTNFSWEDLSSLSPEALSSLSHEGEQENRMRTIRDILKEFRYGHIKCIEDFESILGLFEQRLMKKVKIHRNFLYQTLPGELTVWADASSCFLNGVNLEKVTDRENWERRAFHRWPGQTHSQYLCAEHFLPRGLWDEREGDKDLSEDEIFFRLALCAYWKDPCAMQKLADELCLRFDQDPSNDEEAQIFKDKEIILRLADDLIQRSNQIFQKTLSEGASSYLCALSYKFMRDDRSLRSKEGSIMGKLKKGIHDDFLSERLLCCLEQAGGLEKKRRGESLKSIIATLESLESGQQELGPYHLKRISLSYIEKGDEDENLQASFSAYVSAGERGVAFGFIKAASLLMSDPRLDTTQTPEDYWEKAAQKGDLSGYRMGADFYWREYQRNKMPEHYEKAKGLYEKLMNQGDESGAINYAHLLREEGDRRKAFDIYVFFGEAYSAAKVANVGGQTYRGILDAYGKRKIRLYNEVKKLINDLLK